MDTTVPRTKIRLRECGRELEELAVALEDGGYAIIPGELRGVAARMIEIREALDQLTSSSS